jgi:hypothetical protein
MGGKKVLFLFLALLLPVCVFVFLKMFGKNEFAVPLIHADGVSQKPSGCDIQYAVPYVLHDSIMVKFTSEKSRLVVLNFGEESAKLKLLLKEFNSDVFYADSKVLSGIWPEQIKFIKECVLLVATNSIVLIDSKKQIRGYYDGSDRDEVDRLEAELNIITKRY